MTLDDLDLDLFLSTYKL